MTSKDFKTGQLVLSPFYSLGPNRIFPRRHGSRNSLIIFFNVLMFGTCLLFKVLGRLAWENEVWKGKAHYVGRREAQRAEISALQAKIEEIARRHQG
jgi:hypothetical protein